jgi:hypothetical protein
MIMATKSKAANHLHRYKKVNLSTTGEYWVYKCEKPMCSHYIPINLAFGKLCECNRCHEPFIIGKIQLTGSNGRPMTRPHCVKCIKRKESDDAQKITDFLKGTSLTDDPNPTSEEM